MVVPESISTDSEERRLRRSVSCLSPDVLSELWTEGTLKISHRAFKTCLCWISQFLFRHITFFNLFYWEAAGFDLCLIITCNDHLHSFSLFCTTESMYFICLLFTHVSSLSASLLQCSHQNAQLNINTGFCIHDTASLFWCTPSDPPLLCWRAALGQWGHLTCRIVDPHNLPLWERPSSWRGEQSENKQEMIDRNPISPRIEWWESRRLSRTWLSSILRWVQQNGSTVMRWGR